MGGMLRRADIDEESWQRYIDAGYRPADELLDALPAPDYDVEAYEVQPCPPTRVLEEGDVVDLGDRAFEVLHLPGHSPDSIGLWDATNRRVVLGRRGLRRSAPRLRRPRRHRRLRRDDGAAARAARRGRARRPRPELRPRPPRRAVRRVHRPRPTNLRDFGAHCAPYSRRFVLWGGEQVVGDLADARGDVVAVLFGERGADADRHRSRREILGRAGTGRARTPRWSGARRSSTARPCPRRSGGRAARGCRRPAARRTSARPGSVPPAARRSCGARSRRRARTT